jgi:hypothetical protein
MKHHFMIGVAVLVALMACNSATTQTIIAYSNPIVITKGGTYSGNWQSLDANVAAVEVRTSELVKIINSNIRSLGTGISAFEKDGQLEIENVKAEAVYPSTARATKGTFADVAAFKSVRIENNEITGYATGIRLLNFGTDVSRRGQIAKVRFNRFHNMDGRMSNGQGGFLLEHKANGQAIGINTILEANVEIAWNEMINLPYQSQTEDVISTYESGGTATTPIKIHDNYVQGNYAADPMAKIDFSGAGINLGDAPSKSALVGYTDAYDNQVVSFENSGMGISAGHDQRIWNNRVVSASYLPGGKLLGSTWRSPYGFWNYYKSPYWANNQLRDNVYSVASNDLNRQPIFDPSGTPQTVFGNTELFDRVPTSSDEQDEFVLWQNKVKASSIILGVR